MPSTARDSTRGRRAAKACSFCRLRKFRCNSQSPQCSNCIQYGKDCVYDDLPKRPRPSFARLAALEEENKRLQEALRDASTASRSGAPSRERDNSPRAASRERGRTQETPSREQDGTEERQSSTAPAKSSPRQTESIELDNDDELSQDEDDGAVSAAAPDVAPGTPLRTSSPSVNASNISTSHPQSPSSPPPPPRIESRPQEPQTPAGPSLPPPTGSGSRLGRGSETRYHGPTSTLFDETAAREAHGRRQHAPHNNAAAGGNGGSESSNYWVQKSLFAEAASQRHRETINLAAGKLDFDGVDPDLGMHLLQLHWNRQHHSFLITYRPAFMRDMACGGPYFSRLLLNAIFFGASKFSNRLEVRRDPNDVRTAGWLYRERVRQLLGSALDRSDITTIQALLVMTSSLFALGDERSAAWLYAGTAFRMIIDLGMHVDGSGSNQRGGGLTEEDIEIRRRVFWGAFVVDKIQSLYQGRPVSLQEIETSVPLAFNDEYEELENWSPFAYSFAGGGVARDYPGRPAYSVSCFTQLCRLSLIMNGILNAVYAERSVKKKPEELAEDLQRLHADLVTWKAELPPHLDFDPATQNTPPPHVLSLLAVHNVLLILLHRPFVSDGHLHANLRALSTRSFMTCAQAATAIVALLRSYNAAFSVRRAPYLISYATYVAATIHVRIAAQPGFATEAKEALAICLMVFDENSETNWAVKRAKAVIGGLMQRMGVNVEPADANNTAATTATTATTANSRTEDAAAMMALAEGVPTKRGLPSTAASPQTQTQLHISPRAGSKRSTQSRDKHLLHTPRRRQRQKLQQDASRDLSGSNDGSATSIPMEVMSSTVSITSASDGSPAMRMNPPGNDDNDNNNDNNNVPTEAATFDIDAIISSFISNQQPPLAGAFKSLPSPDNGQQPQQHQHQQTPHFLQQQRPQSSPALPPGPGRPTYAEHFLPPQAMATAYPSPSPTAQAHAHAHAQAPTPAAMHTPHSVPSSTPGHYLQQQQQHQQHHHPGGSPWFVPPAPPPAPPGMPLAYHNAMMQQQQQTPSVAASPRYTGVDQQQQQQQQQGPWQPASGVNGGMHASDLLFGFNSSVLDGVGWEFDDGRY